jgi:signal-transduction protein with cAMP-binding, CBS, and nucleotidyltransferase domain
VAPETFFADRDERDWDRLLAATETRRFRPGEVVLADGVADRALYLLADGRLEVVRPGARGVLARRSSSTAGRAGSRCAPSATGRSSA